MKLTNNQIFGLYGVLSRIIQDQSNILPIRTGFLIIKNYHQLETVELSIEEMRQNIILKYTDNNPKKMEDKNILDQINKELSELGLIENEVDLIKINLKDLEKLSLSLININDLYPIIQE